jgi:hypothetical protein
MASDERTEDMDTTMATLSTDTLIEYVRDTSAGLSFRLDAEAELTRRGLSVRRADGTLS